MKKQIIIMYVSSIMDNDRYYNMEEVGYERN